MAHLILKEEDVHVAIWKDAQMAVIMVSDREVLQSLLQMWNTALYPDPASYSTLLLKESDWPKVEVAGEGMWPVAIAFNITEETPVHNGLVGHIWTTLDSDGVLFYSLLQIRSVAGMVVISPVFSTVTSVIGLDCDMELVLPFTGGISVVKVPPQEGRVDA